jgi:gliding motility-associated lipoprotein GldD
MISLSDTMLKRLLPGLGLVFLLSCDGNYTPKPRGYFRIDFPNKDYKAYAGDCPFTFEYPVYSRVEKDDREDFPCWLNVVFPSFKGNLHISYRSIKGDLNSLMEDTRTLVYKHTVKADAINEISLNNPPNVSGVLYEIEGNAASPVQFYLTDSSRHFLRAALYFYTVPRPDSIAPVVEFIRTDLDRLIRSFRWK